MKTLLTLALLSIAFGTVAQRSSSKRITTDGRQLRIRVDIEQSGRSVHYNRLFDVEGMDISTVKALENRIVDSLEQAVADQSTVVIPRQERTRKTVQEPCTESVTYVASSGGTSYSHDYSTQAKDTPPFSPGDVAPSSVRVREDKENGRLWMQYTFEKDGEELIIERTANVLGKSEREKQAIIKETERSFGIKTGNQ